ncbi:ABC transporter ATP-binding protein [Eubacterium xylanophilum]|uniref:ABC transporter ATP-binding protein n=1 Tax=Eubacterium xylanophilum TaxID=39497 RepID=UPI00047C6B27|nr:ATP-binding cassette domain-containing protein [Eubacterium xylanophilum]
MITIDNLNKSFWRKSILKGITVELDSNCYGLLGPNGAGKTTLIRCILGLYRTKKGSISIATEKCIGYLPQKYGAFRELTVHDALTYFARAKGIPNGECDQEIKRVLELVNLGEEEKKRVGHLSGGMLRRVGIAQALLGNPDIIIFDEPTAGLDPEERMRFNSLINDIKEGKTILISTHIIEDLEETCDRVLVMKNGNIIADKTAEELQIIGENQKTGSEKSMMRGYLAIMDGAIE